MVRYTRPVTARPKCFSSLEREKCIDLSGEALREEGKGAGTHHERVNNQFANISVS